MIFLKIFLRGRGKKGERGVFILELFPNFAPTLFSAKINYLYILSTLALTVTQKVKIIFVGKWKKILSNILCDFGIDS